jgi:hypothetical protein
MMLIYSFDGIPLIVMVGFRSGEGRAHRSIGGYERLFHSFQLS